MPTVVEFKFKNTVTNQMLVVYSSGLQKAKKLLEDTFTDVWKDLETTDVIVLSAEKARALAIVALVCTSNPCNMPVMVVYDFELMRKVAAIRDSRFLVEQMEPIPVGDNPFDHDYASMGTPLVRGFIAMHPGYDAKTPKEGNQYPMGSFYVVNTRTGNRARIHVDDSF